LEFIYQFEVNKGTKEVFGNFFFKATKSENSNASHLKEIFAPRASLTPLSCSPNFPRAQ